MEDDLLERARLGKQDLLQNWGEELEPEELSQTPSALCVACLDSKTEQLWKQLGLAPGEVLFYYDFCSLVPKWSNEKGHVSKKFLAAIKHLLSGFSTKKDGPKKVFFFAHSECEAILTLLSIIGFSLGKNKAKDYEGEYLSELYASDLKKKLDEELKSRGLLAKDIKFKELWSLAAKTAVRMSVENMFTYPGVSKNVSGGRLKVAAYYYDAQTLSLEKLPLKTLG